jgi:hypothetical protein
LRAYYSNVVSRAPLSEYAVHASENLNWTDQIEFLHGRHRKDNY